MSSLQSPFLGFVWSMGTREDLQCVKGISYFPVLNDRGDEVNTCYAAMVSTENFVVPYKVHVSKYVIAEVDDQKNDAGDSYFELSPEWKSELQTEGSLPASLPAYQIGIGSYLPAIGLVLLFVAYIVYVIAQNSGANVGVSEDQKDDK